MRSTLPDDLPVAPTRDYTIPPYDRDALLIEVELLLDWYVPHIAARDRSPGSRATVRAIWARGARADRRGRRAPGRCATYHSPNLIWLPRARRACARVGILDFQDALMGHPAYDVASLLQDARVDRVGRARTEAARPLRASGAARSAAFDMAAFARAYAIMGAQRKTKILGIFARLDRRDGKPHYLRASAAHRDYLPRDLAHPALAGLKAW